VKVTYYKGPSTCPVKIGGAGPPRAEREMILEVLEEQPKEKIPEIKWIIVE
jgi:hypothetical protein